MSEQRKERRKEKEEAAAPSRRDWLRKAVYGVLVLAAFGVAYYLGLRSQHKYDGFARCLSERGLKMYGAYWCPHCQAQKKLFGSSQKLLPYVECSTADGTAQIQVCTDKKITGYPTWEFADGSRLGGEIPLVQLADKTSCVLPQ